MDIVISVISVFLSPLLIFCVMYFRRFSYLRMTRKFENRKQRFKQELEYFFSSGGLLLFEFPLYIMMFNFLYYIENGPFSRLPLWIFQLILLLLVITFIGIAIVSYRHTKKEFYPYFIDGDGKSTWTERTEVPASVLYAMFISGNIGSTLEHLMVLFEVSVILGGIMGLLLLGLIYLGFKFFSKSLNNVSKQLKSEHSQNRSI